MENFDPKSDKIVISIKEFTLIKILLATKIQ